jgi:hypothetical protein
VVTDGLRVPGTHGNVVDDAEPHGLARFRMVARRVYKAECAVERSLSALLGRFHDCARGMERRIEAALGQVRVRVKLAWSGMSYHLDVFAGMHAGEVVKRCFAGFQDNELPPEAGGLQEIADRGEPFPGIGVPRRRLVKQEYIIIDKPDLVHAVSIHEYAVFDEQISRAKGHEAALSAAAAG